MENLVAQSDKEKSFLKFAAPVLKQTGFEFVRIRYYGSSETTLQIMFDHETREISLNDCEAISRKLSKYLEENRSPLDFSFLEVSTPGVDRPLTRKRDFKEWKGSEIKVKYKYSNRDKKPTKGTLGDANETSFKLINNDNITEIDINSIAEANILS